MNKNVVLGIFVGLIVIGFLVMEFMFITQDQKEKIVYEDCIQEFADKYCESINLSKAKFWGNGLNTKIYFECNDERVYEGKGKFVVTDYEKEYCLDLSQGGEQ